MRARAGAIDVNDLVTKAENRTGSSDTERRARARALTIATYQFLAEQTAYDEEEEELGDDGKVAGPGEGLVSVTASRQRLRLLERHEAAGCA